MIGKSNKIKKQKDTDCMKCGSAIHEQTFYLFETMRYDFW